MSQIMTRERIKALADAFLESGVTSAAVVQVPRTPGGIALCRLYMAKHHLPINVTTDGEHIIFSVISEIEGEPV